LIFFHRKDTSLVSIPMTLFSCGLNLPLSPQPLISGAGPPIKNWKFSLCFLSQFSVMLKEALCPQVPLPFVGFFVSPVVGFLVEFPNFPRPAGDLPTLGGKFAKSETPWYNPLPFSSNYRVTSPPPCSLRAWSLPNGRPPPTKECFFDVFFSVFPPPPELAFLPPPPLTPPLPLYQSFETGPEVTPRSAFFFSSFPPYTVAFPLSF